jgi:hypothetical protein
MARAWTRLTRRAGPRSQVAEPQNVLRCARAAIAPVESVQPEHAVDLSRRRPVPTFFINALADIGVRSRHEAANSFARMYHASHDRLGATGARGGPSALSARGPPGCPQRSALRSDVVRRTASRGGTLRCAGSRRVAYHDVDKSYASHRLI